MLSGVLHTPSWADPGLGLPNGAPARVLEVVLAALKVRVRRLGLRMLSGRRALTLLLAGCVVLAPVYVSVGLGMTPNHGGWWMVNLDEHAPPNLLLLWSLGAAVASFPLPHPEACVHGPWWHGNT